MRKILVTLTSLLVITSLQSQSIYGKIVSSARDYIILKSSDKYGLKSNIDTIELEKDGSFSFLIPYNFKVSNGRLEITSKQSIPIWLNIDQKLVIELLDSSLVPKFSGELGRINKYLYEAKSFDTELYNSYRQKNPSFVSYSNSRSDEYFIIMDSMTNDQILFLEKSFHNSNNKVEQLFIAQRKKDIIFSNLFYKISYNDPCLEKLSFYQKRLDITYPTSFAYSDEINFNDPAILSPALLRFGRSFFMALVFRYQKAQKTKLSRDAFYDKLFSEIDRFSKNELCNAILKASFIRDEISIMSLNQSSSLATYHRFIDSLLSYRQITNEAQFIELRNNMKLGHSITFKIGH